MDGQLALISSRPPKEYETWLLDFMNQVADHKVTGIAVVALLEEPLENGGDAFTAYYQMSLRDRHTAAGLIQTDITYKIAQAAVHDALDPQDPEEDTE